MKDSQRTGLISNYALSLFSDIVRMNHMYKLPIHFRPTPEDATETRILAFEDILREECDEINAIACVKQRLDETENLDQSELDYLTELSDLLGDIVVYCFSEALRNGIPLFAVLEIIMQSNFSKLGADGKPIHDERGKFLKGPNYWKPEPRIRELLSKLKHLSPSQTEEGTSDSVSEQLTKDPAPQ